MMILPEKKNHNENNDSLDVCQKYVDLTWWEMDKCFKAAVEL